MNLTVHPAHKLHGSIDLPASKSYSIRAYFIAACGGSSRIIAPSDCDDAVAALNVARTFGATVRERAGGFSLTMPKAPLRRDSLKVDVNESGTSLRFVLPLLPFHALSGEVLGRGTLIGRPNRHLLESLRTCGLAVRGSGPEESVPILYHGEQMKGGRVVIDGSVSSQFISALMIAAPRAAEDTRLVMAGTTLVSRDYVVMTLQILKRAGIRIVQRSRREYLIPGRQSFKGLKAFRVPSDFGLAAFWMSAAALVPSRVTLRGHFDDRLVQSDGAILGFLRRMGSRLTRASGSISINGPFAFKGGTFSLKDCPDLVPIMAVTALFAKGTTRLKDIGHARVKESDRISDLRRELLKVGADIEEKADELIIRPKGSYAGGVELDPHHDHRLAMAFAVLGLKIGVTVRDIECTAKSYPQFVTHLKKLSA
jgi:3-phosphoshikimate 1-carboxyvinyltransferase